MSKTQEIFNPQKNVLHHLGTVLEYLEGKNTDPINLEIDLLMHAIILVHFVFQAIFI